VEWTNGQAEAKRLVGEWLRSGRQIFRLFGYAGTGKTTIARALAEGLRVGYCAYTGKAALQMRRAGCHEPTTIHRLIYQPAGASEARLDALEGERDDPATDDGRRRELAAEIATEERRLRTPRFSLKPPDALQDRDLLVVDECSMVDDQMAKDLLSFGVKLLVLGDPAQLPPVNGGEGALTREAPDVLLTEVHRQAEGSPILRLATFVREGGDLWSLAGRGVEGCEIIAGTIDRKRAIECDQVIVGKNDTRHAFNAWARKHLGFSGPIPQVGEKVVCLRNNHDLEILNGETFWVHEVQTPEAKWPTLALSRDKDSGKASVVTKVHRDLFDGCDPPYRESGAASWFGYGYAMTAHKAQGSGWDRVAVVDQSFVARGHRRRWVYTAITRAAKELVIYRTA